MCAGCCTGNWVTWNVLREAIEKTDAREQDAIKQLHQRVPEPGFRDSTSRATSMADGRTRGRRWLPSWQAAGGQFERQKWLIDWLEAGIRNASPKTVPDAGEAGFRRRSRRRPAKPQAEKKAEEPAKPQAEKKTQVAGRNRSRRKKPGGVRRHRHVERVPRCRRRRRSGW